jgi:integrase
MSRGDGSVFLRGKIYWIAYWFRGKPYQESSGSTDQRVARKLLRARLRRIDKPNFIDPNKELRYTIGDMKNLLITSYEHEQRKSIATMRSCFKHVEKFFEFNRVADIDEVQIDKFIGSRLKAGMQRSTVNRLLAYLRHGFRLMFEKRMISRVPVIKLLDGENVRQGFIAAGDLSALLGEIEDPDTRDIVEYLYASGWRSTEAMQFRWSWIDGNMIRLPAQYSKNKKERLMPVIGTIRDVIERRQAKRRIDCEFVFHRNGKPIKFFRDSFKTAAKNVGANGTLPHDMRRSAVRNFRRSGLSEQEGMALSGHQTSSIYRRYSIISEEDLIQSMERVEEHLKTEKQNRKVTPINQRKA